MLTQLVNPCVEHVLITTTFSGGSFDQTKSYFALEQLIIQCSRDHQLVTQYSCPSTIGHDNNQLVKWKQVMTLCKYVIQM